MDIKWRDFTLLDFMWFIAYLLRESIVFICLIYIKMIFGIAPN